MKKNSYTSLALVILALSLISLSTGIFLLFTSLSNFPSISNIYKDDKELIISFSKGSSILLKNNYCFVSNTEIIPNTNDSNWKLIDDDKCIFDISDGNKYIYLKNGNNEIKEVFDNNNKYKLSSLTVNKEKIYLAVGQKEEIKYNLVTYAMKNNLKWTSSDDGVATVSNGVVTGNKAGKANITISINNLIKNVEVVVTDKLVVRPEHYNDKKEYLWCNAYTKEEAHLIDEILDYKIKNVGGYKTRAAVVEAARFLTLDFPYRIDYFFENGRLHNTGTNYVDGEGRYYHKGLYLSVDKYDTIEKSFAGPAMWGCPLTNYEDFWSKYVSGGKNSNGLDCSGFVTWTLINGGIDVGDVGADYTLDSSLIMNNQEIVHRIDYEVASNAKAGDLISYWGHIAIIVGVDDTNLYVAESLPEYGGVVIKTYNKKTVNKNFDFITYMDTLYDGDGLYTAMWY